MATTCKLIGKTTLGSAASSITFSSIPATYTDLILVCSLRSNYTAGNDDYALLQFNGETATTNYSFRTLQKDGGSVGSASVTGVASVAYLRVCSANHTASTFASNEVYIPNYAGSTNKSVSTTGAAENNGTAQIMGAYAGLWANTAAINEVRIVVGAGTNFVADSSAFLYGITKA